MEAQNDVNYVVAIGASAGGIAAIQDLLSTIPSDLNAPIIVALHSSEKSILTDILQCDERLNIKKAENNEQIKPGWIYVLPGATHGFLKGNTIQLSEVVRDSGFRPSIDALFMSLASEYGDKGIAVVLSGSLKDGMRGTQVLFDMGGKTLVQSPDEAEQPSMPNSVIYNDHPHEVSSAKELGKWLLNRVGRLPSQ